MSRFKIGDMVKIKEDLLCGVLYNGYSFYGDMVNYKGKKATVIDVSLSIVGGHYYSLDVDKGRFVWSDGMLDKVDVEKKYEGFGDLALKLDYACRLLGMTVDELDEKYEDEEKYSELKKYIIGFNDELNDKICKHQKGCIASECKFEHFKKRLGLDRYGCTYVYTMCKMLNVDWEE